MAKPPKILPRPEVQRTPLDQHGALDFAELARLGISPDEIIDFSTNGNSYGASPLAAAAIQRTIIDRYPDRESLALRDALAQQFNLNRAQIIVGNGTAEILWLIALAFLRPADRVLILAPTFGEYARSVALMGAQVEELRANIEDNFTFSAETIHQACVGVSPRLAFICNPNNPTGGVLAPQIIRALAKAYPQTLFIIDEAYLQFVPKMPSSIALNLPNLLALRSMTKDYAIAGLRLGYALGPADLITALVKVRPPWNVNAVAQEVGLASLMDIEYLPKTISRLHAAKQDLVAGIQALGLAPSPSATHYFLVQVRSAAKLRQQLLERRIQVRDCTSFGLPDHIRIATKTPPENEKLLAALKEGMTALNRDEVFNR